MGLREEGIEQAKEAVAIFELLGDMLEQARSLIRLAHLLHCDKQLGAASHAIILIPEERHEFLLCESHRLLGGIYQSRRDKKKAIHHHEVALGIASASNWHDSLFWIYYKLAELFRDDGRFDEAHARIELAKSHAAGSPYSFSRATELEARVLREQHRFEEAKFKALRAADVYEKLGAARDAERCKKFLKRIEEGLNNPTSSGQSRLSCKLLSAVSSLSRVNLAL